MKIIIDTELELKMRSRFDLRTDGIILNLTLRF